MTETISSTKTRILYLDFLRACAVLYVVSIRHLDDYANDLYYGKLDNILTNVALGILIYISGYLLSINNPIETVKDIEAFFIKRFLRTYPLYILALVLFMFCSYLTFGSLLMHVVLFNVVLDQSVMTLWFVAIICVYYLIFPLLVYRYSIVKTIMALVIFIAVVAAFRIKFDLFDTRLLIHLPLFVAGIIVCKHESLQRLLQNRTFIIGCTSLFIIASFFYSQGFAFKRVSMMIFMLASIPGVLFLGKHLAQTINEELIKKIAYASFCMYLFHRVIFYIISNTYIPSVQISAIIYLTLVGVPIIYFLSYYFQRFYDQLVFRLSLTK